MSRPIPVVLGCATALIVFILLMTLMSRQERYECYKWSHDATQYEGYYLLPWQKAQCDAYGIFINAPIQK